MLEMTKTELLQGIRTVALKLRLVTEVTTKAPATVLIVDDEPTIVELIDKVLRSVGHETATATNGQHALEVFAGLPKCDLLLTDLRMPNMSGQELAARLHSLVPDLKVLYLTGFVDGLFEDRSLLWPNEAFLEKPCSARGVCEAVALALAGNPHMVPQPSPTWRQSA